MKTRVKQTKDMGRGVFAAKDFNIGNLVEISPCIILEKGDQLLSKSELTYYVFRNDENPEQSAVALGVGSLFNHSWKPNVTYKYHAETNTVVFRAQRKIKKGAQLFIDYGYDPVSEREHRERWKQLQKLREEENGDSKQRQIEQAPDLPGIPETTFERSGAV